MSSPRTEQVLVIYWEWTDDTPHAGARFWGAHSVDRDGRIADWPKIGLRPIGAATVTVTEGVGLELLDSSNATARAKPLTPTTSE